MSIEQKEIERYIDLQVGKKCPKCKVGKLIKCYTVFCENCGKEPFKNYG